MTKPFSVPVRRTKTQNESCPFQSDGFVIAYSKIAALIFVFCLKLSN